MDRRLLLVLLILLSTVSYADYKDPTEPATYNAGRSKLQETESVNNFVLDAVFMSEDKKLAVVNNQMVKVGDSIGDAKVKSINLNSVILAGDHGDIILHLVGESVKEAVK